METMISGVQTHYERKGTGDAVLILEGWGTNTDVYASVSEILEENYTVYTVDFPGFGRSKEPREVWDVARYAGFVRDFAREMKLKKLSLIGHSFGGRVIFKLYEEPLPFTVDRIVLIDSAGVKPPDTLKKKLRRARYKFCRKTLEIFTPGKVEKYRLAHSSADYRAASPMMREILKKTVAEDLKDLFPRVSAPTLLIWGRNDASTPLEDARIMEKAIPDAGLVVLEGGHYSFLDSPSVFANVMRSFFKI